MWQYPRLRFKASITRQHKPVVILPSSFCVEMFTRPLSCCRCDQFLLWYEVTVKICQCLSAKTALSCLCAKTQRLHNVSHSFLFVVVWKLVLETEMHLERFDVLAYSFFMSSSWLNIFTNQRSYFLDEQLECQKQSNQSSCRSFCVSVLFRLISHTWIWNAAPHSDIETTAGFARPARGGNVPQLFHMAVNTKSTNMEWG